MEKWFYRNNSKKRKLDPNEDVFWKKRGYPSKPDNWKTLLFNEGYYAPKYNVVVPHIRRRSLNYRRSLRNSKRNSKSKQRLSVNEDDWLTTDDSYSNLEDTQAPNQNIIISSHQEALTHRKSEANEEILHKTDYRQIETEFEDINLQSEADEIGSNQEYVQSENGELILNNTQIEPETNKTQCCCCFPKIFSCCRKKKSNKTI